MFTKYMHRYIKSLKLEKNNLDYLLNEFKIHPDYFLYVDLNPLFSLDIITKLTTEQIHDIYKFMKNAQNQLKKIDAIKLFINFLEKHGYNITEVELKTLKDLKLIPTHYMLYISPRIIDLNYNVQEMDVKWINELYYNIFIRKV